MRRPTLLSSSFAHDTLPTSEPARRLTSAEKKILTFVSIRSGDISVYRSCHILLQASAVTSSSDKRRSNRDALSRIAELSRGTSRETPSLDRDSTHFSLSWQQKHTSAFCKRSSEQLPHLHLYKNIKTVVSRGIIDSEHRSVDRSYTIAEINS